MDEEDKFSTPSKHSKKWDEADRREREAELYGPGYKEPELNNGILGKVWKYGGVITFAILITWILIMRAIT